MDSIENLWTIPSCLVSGFRVRGLDCPRPVILSTPDGPRRIRRPRVRRRTRTTRQLPTVEAPAAARNPEALVRLEDLRVGDAALPGLQNIRYGRRVKRGKLICPAGSRTTAVFSFLRSAIHFNLRLHARAK